MNKLYPLKFKPIYKDKIWGGQKIKNQLGHQVGNLPNCGEAWLLSGVEGSQTEVANGYLAGNDLNELTEVYMDDLVGGKVYDKYGETFPILVKVIDANDYLSVQVHPNDEMAMERHNSLGKTEMWYIMDADPGSELICGFNQKMDREKYINALLDKKIPDIMNREAVKKGDVFFIPAGRVHALGPGLLLAEIQETSDITYRIYDWDRIDAAGEFRELHTELALDAIDFEQHDAYKTAYSEKENETAPVVSCEHFTTNILHLSKPIEKDYEELDSFVIYTCTEGAFRLEADGEKVEVKAGEALLLPATTTRVNLYPIKETRLLEVYIL
ncbi:MAG: mannose-6-phosphate isomerase [Bacteroidota bacterium]|nr:mannose-6-phosphate isomerase [Bacteroidota bacterium]